MQEGKLKRSAKEIEIWPIAKKHADRVIKRIHYSGKVVNNSQLNFGVFLDKKLLGAMQYGPPMHKSQLIGLVKNTRWNGFFELNRLAFSDKLPKFSETRAIALSFKWMKKEAKHIKWIVSFADGCQCGHGTIYQAANFKLTQINRSTTLYLLPDGRIKTRISLRPDANKEMLQDGFTSVKKWLNAKQAGWSILPGFMLRYIYFLDKKVEKDFTGEFIPFAKIREMGAAMYKGVKIDQ